MKLVTKSKILLYLFWLFVFPTTCQTKAEDISSEQFTAVVELAIFCDVDYTRAFENNSELLKKYWSALVLDAHLKFQTVTGTDISFRINSITTLQDTDQQQIIEKHRSSDRTLQGYEVLFSFGAWLHQKAVSEHFINYDIAVLAVGSMFSNNEFVGVTRELGSACSWDIYQEVVKSILLFTSRHEDPTDTLAHEIAHLLNSPHDNESEYNENNCEEFNATEHEFLMGPYKNHRIQQYKFSPCSIKSIKRFLDDERSTCLKETQIKVAPIMDTSLYCDVSKYMGSVSVEEQCQTLLNNRRAYVTNDEYECFNLKCHLDLGSGLFSKNVVFDPLEGSPCGEEESRGRCFMGSCVPHGGHLVNVATGMCLEKGNPFEHPGEVSMYNCLSGKSWTPLDLVIIEGTGNTTVRIKFLDLNDSATQTEEKCLTFNRERGQVIFESCQPQLPEGFWEVRDLSDNNHDNESGAFFIVHNLSEKCLTVSEEYEDFLVTSNCSVVNTKQHWWYLSESDMLENLNCNKDYSLKANRDVNDTDTEAYIYVDSELLAVILLIMFVILVAYIFSNLIRDITKEV